MAQRSSETSCCSHESLPHACLQSCPSRGRRLSTSSILGTSAEEQHDIKDANLQDSGNKQTDAQNHRSMVSRPQENSGSFIQKTARTTIATAQVHSSTAFAGSPSRTHVTAAAPQSAASSSAVITAFSPHPASPSLSNSASSSGGSQPDIPSNAQPTNLPHMPVTTTASTPSLFSSLLLLAQPQLPSQARGTKRPYEPQPNRIGATQTYNMNRFIDERTDFRTALLSLDEQQAITRTKRRRIALKTRVNVLEVMIGF